jgi:hypothetical protein
MRPLRTKNRGRVFDLAQIVQTANPAVEVVASRRRCLGVKRRYSHDFEDEPGVDRPRGELVRLPGKGSSDRSGHVTYPFWALPIPNLFRIKAGLHSRP